MTHTVTAPEPASKPKRPVLPHLLRILALPIVLFWIAIAVLVNVVAPPSSRSSARCTRPPQWRPKMRRR